MRAVVETLAHRRLKVLSLAFLRGTGCQAVASEVRCPIGRFRADAAGYRDLATPDRSGTPARRGRRIPPQTVIVECKQSRGDFLRDRASADRLLAERRELERICRAMERQRVMVEEPHLRSTGASLFPELEAWDFSASRLPGYRRLVRRLCRLDLKLYGQTKFCMLARYRQADRLYLAAPRGMVRPGELPAGWGLLECSSSALERGDAEPADLEVRVEAPSLECREEHRHRLLRNIAVSASFAAERRRG